MNIKSNEINLSSAYNYSESVSAFKIFCADDYNAQAYRDIFSRRVNRVLGFIAAGSFIGLAVFRPDVLVLLMDRVVQYVPAIMGEFLKTLDFANSMIMQAIGVCLSYGTSYMTSSYLLHYSLYFIFKLAFLIGRKTNLIAMNYPKLLNTEEIRLGLEKFNSFKKTLKMEHSVEMTAQMFDQIVKGFKKSFGLKSIKKAFSYSAFKHIEQELSQIRQAMPPLMLFDNYSKIAKQNRLFDIFILDPDIRSYLSRKKVKYKNDLLVLDSKSEHHFYQKEYGPFIDYRDCYEGDVLESFYKSASGKTHAVKNFSIEQPKIQKLLKENIHVLFGQDIGQIRNDTAEIAKQKKAIENAKFSYYLFVGGKDNHSYLTVSIFDATGDALCILLLNSWINDWYYNYLKERLDCDGRDEICPFIDCSIDPQANINDANCGLYSSIIGRAFIQLLDEESDKIFENYKNASQELKSQAAETLSKFIKSNILKYLPEFYVKNENGFVRKSMEEIRDFHMQRRWDIGNLHIDELVQQSKERSFAF